MTTETQTTPQTSTFAIKGPYLSAGRTNIDLARTDLLWLSFKINAEGGENAVHAHTDEDHAFVILEARSRSSTTRAMGRCSASTRES